MSEKHEVIENFTEEHREVRDTLMDLVEAVKRDDVETAREKLAEIDELSGPHFRYEEETLYPALVEYFGEEQVIDLVEEHDEAIETARELDKLLQDETVPEDEKDSIVETVSPLLVHVSDCEGLTIYMEEMSDETLDKVAESRERALEENAPLTEYAGEIRRSPEENIKAF
jgi:hemerythrin-like domain-containing protein